MEMVKTIFLGELSRELTGLVAGAAWAGEAAVLSRSRVLLETIRARPAEVPTFEQEALPSSGWRAIRVADDAGHEEVLCWSEADNAQVRGQWRGGVLAGVWVQVGSDFWSSQAAPFGETWASSKGDTPGPGDESFSRRLEVQVREAWQKLEQDRARPAWVCARCGWENGEDDARCRGCLGPRAASEDQVLAASLGAVGGIAAVPAAVRGELSASGEMEMPSGWQDLADQLRDELIARIKDGLGKAASSRRVDRSTKQRGTG